MKVVFNTGVSFSNFGSYSSHRVVEIPEELVKPYLKAGIATEISSDAPVGLKVSNPIPKEWLLVEKKVTEKKSQSTKKKTKESVE